MFKYSRTVIKSIGIRFLSTTKFKNVTHCIFDMDGLLLVVADNMELAILNASKVQIGNLESKNYKTWRYKILTVLKAMPGSTDILEGKKTEPSLAPTANAEEKAVYTKDLQCFQTLNSAILILFTTNMSDDILQKVLRFDYAKDMWDELDRIFGDTEMVYKKMITHLCASYGHEYTDELMMKVLGGTEQRLSEILCKELRLPVSPEGFRNQLLELGDTMLAGTPLLDGAEMLIKHLHKTKVPFALATSSSERSVVTKIAKHKDIFDLFHHMVMGSSDPEVKHGKPNPDIFLVAAARFPDKPNPSKCLVFEDSPHGVTAGISAGMQVVMVPDPHLDKKFTEHATIVLPSLSKFRPELFGLPAFQ